jgi:Tfp pilus assembly protein PilO
VKKGPNFTAYTGLQSATNNLHSAQAKSKDAKHLSKELADSQASLKDSATKLQYLEQGVQDYAYVPTLLSELDKLGKANGIDVVGVRPIAKPPSIKKEDPDAEKPKKKTYDELDIEVKGRGKYRSVMNFLEALAKFPKIVASRTVELSPKNTPGSTGSALDVTINLRAYVFSSAQPAPKTTAMATGSTHEG